MIAGMDEAGRGPAIGPLVFGLVIVTKTEEKQLQEAGINDSKQLTAKQREQMQQKILEIVEMSDTLVVSAAEIDELRNEMTLNQIEVKFFKQLLNRYKDNVDVLQLDAADVNAERFGSNFESMIQGQVISEHKADSKYMSVAAASILAKVERDRQVELLQQQMDEFDEDLPSFGKGYPTQARPFLEAYIEKYKKLPDFARKSWKTSIEVIEAYQTKQSSLQDFF